MVHCNCNSVYIFLFREWRGLSPNFHIHVSVSDLYSPRNGPHISSSRKGRPIVGIYNSLTDTCMWKLGTETPIFLFWEYLFQIFGILSLQCRTMARRKWGNCSRRSQGRSFFQYIFILRYSALSRLSYYINDSKIVSVSAGEPSYLETASYLGN
jgi:hypothetical protein